MQTYVVNFIENGLILPSFLQFLVQHLLASGREELKINFGQVNINPFCA
jgi:hypothetical protein